MKKLILLRTRCGCEKYLEIPYFLGRWYTVVLRPNLRCITQEEEVSPPESSPLKRRLFELDGETQDGIYIYTEILEE